MEHFELLAIPLKCGNDTIFNARVPTGFNRRRR